MNVTHSLVFYNAVRKKIAFQMFIPRRFMGIVAHSSGQSLLGLSF